MTAPRINAAQGVEFSAPVAPMEATERLQEVNFPSDTDEVIAAGNTKQGVIRTLKGNKKNIELNTPWIGTDYIIFKGNGKMTYGQLREQLGIPPKVLSETNDKRLRDEQIVKNVRINIEDIGWYERPRMDEMEARDVRFQRSHGNNHAGYDRAITNKEIINFLRK